MHNFLLTCSRVAKTFRFLSSHFATSAHSVLAGTVAPHSCYVFLHSPEPPKEFPSKISTAVERALHLKLKKWGGDVNFSWSPDQSVLEAPGPGLEPEVYSATAFSVSRGRLEIPEVSLANIDEVEERVREHIEGPPAEPDESQDIHLYVCTHGARDCRCGNTGGAVVNALREEISRRLRAEPHGPSGRMKIAEVGHVGGHKYAANLLVYPHGEWLGNLKPEDVPWVLDSILDKPSRPSAPSDAPLCPHHWRGRMGIGKDEQRQLYSRHI